MCNSRWRIALGIAVDSIQDCRCCLCCCSSGEPELERSSEQRKLRSHKVAANEAPQLPSRPIMRPTWCGRRAHLVAQTSGQEGKFVANSGGTRTDTRLDTAQSATGCDMLLKIERHITPDLVKSNETDSDQQRVACRSGELTWARPLCHGHFLAFEFAYKFKGWQRNRQDRDSLMQTRHFETKEVRPKQLSASRQTHTRTSTSLLTLWAAEYNLIIFKRII